MRRLTGHFGVAFAFLALTAVSARAAGTTFGTGEITIDATVSTASPQCEVLGAILPAVYSGTMMGLFGKQPVQVDIYFGSGALNKESFACQSGEASICTLSGNPLGLVILSDISVCEPQNAVRPNHVIGAWQLAQVTDPSISDAWGMVTGTSAHPEIPTGTLKLSLKAIVLKATATSLP